jgi:hypothetical protein
MKRYRIKSHFRFITFLIIVLLLGTYFVGSLLDLTVADSVDHSHYTTITVASGDTIWSLAESHADGQDVRRVVYDIRELNQLDDCEITSGEHLMIPVYD